MRKLKRKNQQFSSKIYMPHNRRPYPVHVRSTDSLHECLRAGWIVVTVGCLISFQNHILAVIGGALLVAVVGTVTLRIVDQLMKPRMSPMKPSRLIERPPVPTITKYRYDARKTKTDD